jgi:hypothetical protein
MIFLTAALVSFIYIALKAIQQRQVMAAQYWRMPIVSFAMAFCEVFIVGNVAVKAVGDSHLSLMLLACAIGAGGGLGSVIGTWLHARQA